MPNLLSPPVNRNTKKREDPELYAASDLRAYTLTGPVAYNLPEGSVDPTAADEPAIQEEPEEKKTPTRPKRGKNNDPFAGGGNMLQQARKLGRRIAGYEIDSQWVSTANRLLNLEPETETEDV